MIFTPIEAFVWGFLFIFLYDDIKYVASWRSLILKTSIEALNVKNWHLIQVYAVTTQTANIDLFLFPLFCFGCTWILQQVCSIIFFHVEYFIFFQPPCCPFSISADTERCRKNAVVMSSPTGHTWLHSPSLPPPPCPSLPGFQIYHSAICILVQFLMLRLMGRTVTTVMSSFIFQMVSCLIASSSLASWLIL